VLTFLWTTALGIIPGSFVYAYLGHTGAQIEPGESLLSPQIILALVLLGLLSLMPVAGKKLRARRQSRRTQAAEGQAEGPADG
jgi:uncharacterized membrane protein YdjX (TVP38/TMEM64 family)